MGSYRIERWHGMDGSPGLNILFVIWRERVSGREFEQGRKEERLHRDREVVI